MSLVIAIDFDDTFTADPKLMGKFIRQAKDQGHSPVIVTARRETEENTNLVNKFLDENDCQVPIVFTNLQSKLRVMERRGWNVNIWIDDDPEKLVRGH